MKGLGIYTLILMSFMALYAMLSPEYSVLVKLVCVAVYTPTFILAIKVVK